MADLPFSLDDLIRAIRALADEPLEQLAEAARLKDDLEDQADALLGHFVDQARRAGASWSQIGDALGVSKQAAQQRHGGEPSEPKPRWRSRMFTRFTERARRAVEEGAKAAATSLNHNFVGTEHLLLAVLAEEGSVGQVALARAGLDADDVRAAVAALVPPGVTGEAIGSQPLTPRAKKALELALRDALALGHNYIGTEHIVLGLLRLGEGVAYEVLSERGVELDATRSAIVDLLTGR